MQKIEQWSSLLESPTLLLQHPVIFQSGSNLTLGQFRQDAAQIYLALQAQLQTTAPAPDTTRALHQVPSQAQTQVQSQGLTQERKQEHTEQLQVMSQTQTQLLPMLMPLKSFSPEQTQPATLLAQPKQVQQPCSVAANAPAPSTHAANVKVSSERATPRLGILCRDLYHLILALNACWYLRITPVLFGEKTLEQVLPERAEGITQTVNAHHENALNENGQCENGHSKATHCASTHSNPAQHEPVQSENLGLRFIVDGPGDSLALTTADSTAAHWGLIPLTQPTPLNQFTQHNQLSPLGTLASQAPAPVNVQAQSITKDLAPSLDQPLTQAIPQTQPQAVASTFASTLASTVNQSEADRGNKADKGHYGNERNEGNEKPEWTGENKGNKHHGNEKHAEHKEDELALSVSEKARQLFVAHSIDGLSDQLAIDFYTSGSQGHPKLVHKTLGIMERESELIHNEPDLELPVHNCLWLSTVYGTHLYGLTFAVFYPLLHGQTIYRKPIRFSEELNAFKSASQPLSIVSSPTFLQTLDSCLLSSQSLQVCQTFSAGGPLHYTTVNRYTLSPIIDIYGSTETGVLGFNVRRMGHNCAGYKFFEGITRQVSWHEGVQQVQINSPVFASKQPYMLSDALEFGLSAHDLAWNPAPIMPLQHVGLYEILQDNGRQLRFIVKGRLDDVVKIGEQRISLSAVTQTFMSLQEVADCAVVDYQVTGHERLFLGAFIVLTQENKDLAHTRTSRLQLKQHWKQLLQSKLSANAFPRALIFVDTIPGTAMGKHPHALLRQELLQALANQNYNQQAPTTSANSTVTTSSARTSTSDAGNKRAQTNSGSYTETNSSSTCASTPNSANDCTCAQTATNAYALNDMNHAAGHTANEDLSTTASAPNTPCEHEVSASARHESASSKIERESVSCTNLEGKDSKCETSSSLEGEDGKCASSASHGGDGECGAFSNAENCTRRECTGNGESGECAENAQRASHTSGRSAESESAELECAPTCACHPYADQKTTLGSTKDNAPQAGRTLAEIKQQLLKRELQQYEQRQAKRKAYPQNKDNQVALPFVASQVAQAGVFLPQLNTIKVTPEPPLPESAELTLKLEPNMLWFTGHFIDYPILPGVAQISFLQSLIEQVSFQHYTLGNISQVKFTRPLRVGEVLHLAINFKARPNSTTLGVGFTFSCLQGGVNLPCTSGKCEARLNPRATTHESLMNCP